MEWWESIDPALSKKHSTGYNDAMNMTNKPPLILDIECYKNFFLVGCWEPERNNFQFIQPSRLHKLKNHLNRNKNTLVTFNGIHYDLRMLQFAFDCLEEHPDEPLNEPLLIQNLKKFSDFIIEGKPDDPRKAYYNQFWWNSPNHIDLKNVLGGKLVPSLKKLSYRLGFMELESLPIDPTAILTDDEKKKIISYNKVDLKNTWELYKFCQPALDLRTSLSSMYNIDCLSLSDSQIAERVIARDAPKQTAFDPKQPRGMNVAIKKKDYAFQSEPLRQFYDELLSLNIKFYQTYDPIKRKPTFTRKFSEPQEGTRDALETTSMRISGIEPPCEFAFGGIHSTHSRSQSGNTAFDVDATSFYPNLILKHNIYPSGLGENFLKTYREILERRIKAKKEKNKIEADSLKIVLNSTFGKFNEYFSKLRDPISAVSVCLNGQLSILRLMDCCYCNNVDVLMVNTDGIVTRQNPEKAVAQWQEEMKMDLETKEITNYFIQNSNNHILKYKDGSVKIKGAAFAYEKSVSKQNSYPIINESIVKEILDGKPLEDTIEGCRDIHKFLACYAQGYTIEQIKLAESADDEGRNCPAVSRYYLSTESKDKIYKKNAKSWITVADTEGIQLYNKIESIDLPKDLDIKKYIEKAYTKLRKIKGK